MPTRGIYLIKHRASEACYIGQSIDMEGRFNAHRRELRKVATGGWYRNAPSRDPEEFDFKILEIVDDRDERARAEVKWEAHFVKQGCVLLNAAPTGNLAPDGEGLPVINLDTGERYRSAADASRALGLGGGTVSYAANYVGRAGGFRWAFVGKEEEQLGSYEQAALDKLKGRFPREGTSSYRIWSKCIALNNPSNAELYRALPNEKRSQVSTEAWQCRRTHGWKTP